MNNTLIGQKRSLSQKQEEDNSSPSYFQSSPHLKRSRLDNDPVIDNVCANSNSMTQTIIADHYNSRIDTGTEKREGSSIIQSRIVNNWIKTVLINLFVHSKSIVLDFGSGKVTYALICIAVHYLFIKKGGDLRKFGHQRISELVAVDVAFNSITDAMVRYNECYEHNSLLFPLTLICCDAFDKQLSHYLPSDLYFDAVSSHFVIQYAFESEERVRRMLLNVSERLRYNGHFFGSIPDANVLIKKWRNQHQHTIQSSKFRVSFNCLKGSDMDRYKRLSNPFNIEYNFQLKDAIDSCPEYLIHFQTFVDIAKEYELHLVLDCNFHEFFLRFYDHPQFSQLLLKFGLGGTPWSNNRNKSTYRQFPEKPKITSISSEQWEIAYLYKTFAFQKRRTKDVNVIDSYPERKIPKRKLLTKEDILVIP